MCELTIYGTEGDQVVPDTDNDIRAEGRLADHIDNSTDFYLDPEDNRVVAYVRASIGSSRPNHYHAEYVGESGENLIRGLVEQLRALEDGDGEYRNLDWDFMRDRDRFNLAWWADELDSPSLADLGLDLYDWAPINRLITEGEPLDFGIDGYRTAATVVGYYTQRDGDTPSIGVSSGGRISPIQSVDLVLSPGDFDSLTPLTDSTKEAIQKKQQNIEEVVQKDYQDQALGAIDELVNTDQLTAWELYRELTAVEEFVSTTESKEMESVNTNSVPAETVIELVTALRQDERFKELSDPRMLNDSAKARCRNQILNRLVQEREQLADEMPERLRSEFATARESLLTHRVSVVSDSFEALLRLLDGHRENLPESLPSAAHRIREYLDELENDEVLTPKQRNEIRQEVKADLEDTLNTLKERKREQFLERFDRSLLRIDLSDVREDSELVVKIHRAVDSGRSVSADSDLVAQFELVVEDIESTTIFTDNERRQLRLSFIDRINERVKELRQERETVLENQLSAELDTLTQRSGNESLSAMYKRLQVAKQFCSPEPGSSVNHPDIERFAELVHELNQDRVIEQEQADQIRNKLENIVSEELIRIEEQKREDTLQKIENELDNVVSKAGNENEIETAYRKLEELQKYVDGTRHSIDGGRLEHVERLIDEVGAFGNQISIFSPDDAREFRSTIRTAIEERKTEIRESKKERMQLRFESLISDLVDYSVVSSQTKFKILKQIHQFFTHPSEKKSPEKHKIDAEVDSNNRKELVSIGNEASNLIQQSRDSHVDTILTSEQQHDLRNNHFEPTLENAINQTKAAYQADTVETFKREVRDSITSVSKYGTGNSESVAEDVQLLSDIKTRLSGSSRVSITRVSDQAVEIADGFQSDDLLTPNEEHEFKEQLITVLDKYIQERQEIRIDLQKQYFGNLLTELCGEKLRKKEKLVAVYQLQQLLEDTNTKVEQDFLSDTQELRDRRNNLPHDAVSDLVEEAVNKREVIAEEYAEAVASEIEVALEASVEEANDNVNPDVALEQFDRHLSGSEFNPSESRPNLIKAKEKFQQAQELHDTGVLPEDQFENVKCQTHNTIEKLRSDNTISGIARSRNAARKIRNTASSLVKKVDRGGVVILISGLLLVVSLIAILFVGVLGVGPFVDGNPTDDSATVETEGSMANAPTIEVENPTWGQTIIGDAVTVNASVEAERFRLVVLNETGEVIDTKQGEVTNSTVSEQVPVSSQGTYYIVLSASRDEMTTEIVRVQLERATSSAAFESDRQAEVK